MVKAAEARLPTGAVSLPYIPWNVYTSALLTVSCPQTSDRPLTSQKDAFRTVDGTNFEMLPPLPFATGTTCLVIIDENTLFITGGPFPKATKTTFIFKKSRHVVIQIINTLTNTVFFFFFRGLWTKVADMTTARYAHRCALVKNASTGAEEIIVMGGGNAGDGVLDSVEIFSVVSMTWRTATGKV
jgi:uncharacterized membrane protein